MGRSSYEFAAEDDAHQEIEKSGRSLLSPPKGKDALLRLLKGAGDSLAEAAQTSESAKLAARDLAKALGRPEFLRHKDKEVRLYTALCLCHILRLNAPDTPYTDDQLQSIFELLNRTYAELEDPASPHFQLCLSILETVSQVKCSLLILDLPNGEELVCSLFSTLLDVVNEENAEVLEGTVLELLRSMIEEADDLPQQQLDILLARLLPAAAAELPTAYALVAALLQRTETTVQPYLQKFLKALLTGVRTDSELKDDVYELFYAVHETVPQALLPLEPQLREEVEGELDGAKRQAAVDLVAKLLARHPSGGAKILDEYEPLLWALLGRANDAEAAVRRKVVEAAVPLMEACAGHLQRQQAVLKVAMGRLFDHDDSIRRLAAAAVCTLLQQQPHLARSTHTEGRGPVLSILFGRLMDKKLSVRREMATQLAGLLRAWVLAAAESPSAAPDTRLMLSVPLAICHAAVRFPDLGAHVFDTVWKAGIFPAKLAPADVARYWAQMWFQAADDYRPMLTKTLSGKLSMQLLVQRLLALWTDAKELRTSSLAAPASSMGGGTAAASGSTHCGSGMGGQQAVANPEAHLQACSAELARVLQEVAKPEEGLQKLLESKDNHIFRGLATLAACGCTYKDAVAAGKDVVQRVGSKGPAGDTTRVLVARLTPSLLPPEVMHAAMEEAEQSEDVQRFLMEIARKVPLLLAQSLDQVVAMFEADDPVVAECAAKVLAHAGLGMARHWQKSKREVPQALVERLRGMCAENGPTAVKAAVTALLSMLPTDQATSMAGELADMLLARLKARATLANHSMLLAALKGLSVVGRLQPEVFESRAGDVLDFVFTDLMEADLSRGKPLPGVEAHPAAAAGRQWRRPSAVTAIKTAALRTLCQALVPDNTRVPITQAMSERAALVWELLEPLIDTNESEPQFKPFDLVFPSTSDPQHAALRQELRSKRRRGTGGGGSEVEKEEEEEEEGDEEGYLDCTDAAWVRYSAVCGLLRLARAYDAVMPAPLYANLALTFQEPLMEPRRAMTAKLQRTVTLLAARREAAYSQRAAKYAAVLALFAVDPEPRNRTFALRTLRGFVIQRRLAVERMAASTAAAGGAGSTLMQDMPEFLLAFLVFLLAHHPDYPTQERLEEYSQASPEDQEEMYGEGGPFAPFMGMLQFALEALVVPADHPTSASEVARQLPPSLKVLRTLKFCEDACSEPRTEEAHQLCDLGLMLLKQIAGRLTKGKPVDPGRFPGQIVLPRLCFRALAMENQTKKVDGSNMPPARYFSASLYENDLFLRRLLQPGLPGPAGKGRKPRSNPDGGQRRGKVAKLGVSGSSEVLDEEDMAPLREEEKESVGGGTPRQGLDVSDGEGEQQQQQQQRGKRKLPAGTKQQRSSGSKRNRQPAGKDDSKAGSPEGMADKAAASGSKRGAAAVAKPAGTPSRHQPRRGAKSEIAGKLKEASDDDEEDEGWEDDSSQEEAAAQQQHSGGGCAGAPPAAAAQAEGEEDAMSLSNFENASLGSTECRVVHRQVAAVAVVAGAAATAAARRLRADTDDEEEQEPPPLPRQQQRRRQPQKEEDQTSPGQENRTATNGAAAARSGRKDKGKGAAAARPAAKGTAGGGAAKLQLKRSRA